MKNFKVGDTVKNPITGHKGQLVTIHDFLIEKPIYIKWDHGELEELYVSTARELILIKGDYVKQKF